MEDQTNYGNGKSFHKEYNFENGIKIIIEQQSTIKNVEALEKAFDLVNQNNPTTLEEFLITLYSAFQF